MTRISLIAAILILPFVACNQAQQPSVDSNVTGTTEKAPSASLAQADIDPVCGMVRDSTWTDFSLHQGDTVWFCAAIEKKAFDANPGRYLQPSVTPHQH